MSEVTPPSDSEIEEYFQSFLETESWYTYSRVVHDRRYSPFHGAEQRDPRRRVLLCNGEKIVLGFHNENEGSNQVWALSGRGKDSKSDVFHDSWDVRDIVVGEIPGCIEYLETLLTAEDGTCGHSPRLVLTDSTSPHFRPGIPARLCFFSQWSDPDRDLKDDIFYVDTENLCESCYHKAVPKGFNVWSTSYFDMYNNKVDENYRAYFRECWKNNRAPNKYDAKTGSFLRPYWPKCYSAKHRKLALDTADGEYPKLPGGTVVHDCWRWLVWNKAPFYVDQLCVFPPYKIHDDPEKRLEEDRRISKLNAAAYIGAAHGIVGVPPGGRGEWTTVELRILGKRAVRLPQDFGDPNALWNFGPGYIVHGDRSYEPPKLKFSGRLKRDPDHSEMALPQTVESPSMSPSERLPDEQIVLDELMVQVGEPLGPTLEELERNQQFPNRDDYRVTLRKYEELLSYLRERMRETRDPVDKTPHPTILTSKPDPLVNSLIDAIARLDLSGNNKGTTQTHNTQIQGVGPAEKQPVLFYRRFPNGLGEKPKRDPNDVPRGSGRLNRLYCHDASPYVYQGPFRIAEDAAEVEEWLQQLRNDQTRQDSSGEEPMEGLVGRLSSLTL